MNRTMNLPVYLDNHSTTRIDPRVLDAMMPYFTERYGNASSHHHVLGWFAEGAVEQARGDVAGLVGAEADEVCFTSGATESINLALKGVVEGAGTQSPHIITAATEHQAVLATCAALRSYRCDVTTVGVDRDGRVDVDEIARSISPRTICVSVMAANNEIGTLAPLDEIGALCRQHGVLFHTDATQAAGTIPLDVRAMHIGLLSLSAHKMYGPKGVGVLVVKKGVKVARQIDGGGQERGMRAGTLNVPGIVGLGVAARLAVQERVSDAERERTLRDRFENQLAVELGDICFNGDRARRLPNNSSVTIAGISADRLMMEVKDVAMSTGSACGSASAEPSHVLRAIGVRDEALHATLRFGLGRFTTDEEIAYAAGRLVETVRAMRSARPVGSAAVMATR